MTAADLVHRHLPAVVRQVDEHGHDRPQPVHVTLTWRAAAPYDVDAQVAGVSWLLGLELLAAGLDGPAGVGDLMISPHPDGLRHEIVMDSGQAIVGLQVDTLDLRAFLGDVTAVWSPVDVADEHLVALLDWTTS